MPLQRKNKKKEIQPFRAHLFDHHQKKPNRAKRAKFPASVVKQLIREQGIKCQCGCGRDADSTHHVMPRGRDGRGVRTNGMRVNDICNKRFHSNEAELQHWIEVWERRHGSYFWFDKQDWDEHHEKEVKFNQQSTGIINRVERVKPIIDLLVIGANRKLTQEELRFIERAFMDRMDLPVIVNLLREITENKRG